MNKQRTKTFSPPIVEGILLACAALGLTIAVLTVTTTDVHALTQTAYVAGQ
jgi:hypothetical protein